MEKKGSLIMIKTLRNLFEKHPLIMGTLAIPFLPLVVVGVALVIVTSGVSMVCSVLLEDIDEWWRAGK